MAMERQPATPLQRGPGLAWGAGKHVPDLRARAPGSPLPQLPSHSWCGRHQGTLEKGGRDGGAGDGEAAAGGPPWTPRPDRTLLGSVTEGGRSATAPATQLPGVAAMTGSHCCPGLWQGPTQGPRAAEGPGDALSPSCSCRSPGGSLINSCSRTL